MLPLRTLGGAHWSVGISHWLVVGGWLVRDAWLDKEASFLPKALMASPVVWLAVLPNFSPKKWSTQTALSSQRGGVSQGWPDQQISACLCRSLLQISGADLRQVPLNTNMLLFDCWSCTDLEGTAGSITDLEGAAGSISDLEGAAGSISDLGHWRKSFGHTSLLLCASRRCLYVPSGEAGYSCGSSANNKLSPMGAHAQLLIVR